jgi:hypothetical protein
VIVGTPRKMGGIPPPALTHFDPAQTGSDPAAFRFLRPRPPTISLIRALYRETRPAPAPSASYLLDKSPLAPVRRTGGEGVAGRVDPARRGPGVVVQQRQTFPLASSDSFLARDRKRQRQNDTSNAV